MRKAILVSLFAAFGYVACYDVADVPLGETDTGIEVELPEIGPADGLADDTLAQDYGPGPLDGFAECVSSSGAVLYGMSGPYDYMTERQRLEFGRSARLIRTILCDTGEGIDASGINSRCREDGIKRVPTWIFGSGKTLSGTFSLETVAKYTGCKLPEDIGETGTGILRERLARCLDSSGAVLFSATWCGPCQEQKDLFGQSAEVISAIECDLPDNVGICDEFGIDSYPTWMLGGKVMGGGVVSLEALADRSGCPWPNW